MTQFRGRTLVIIALVLLCGCKKQELRITGDSLEEVAISVYSVGRQLPPDQQQAYSAAVDFLGRTAPDRYLAEKYMSITPNLAQRLRGRRPSEVIQMMSVYRSSIPQFTGVDRHRERT